MDSLQLSLNQVNFEEQTLGEGEGEELHAFGNVVSYDSDFQQGGGLPVLAKKLKLKFASSKEGEANESDNSFLYSSTQEEEDIRLYNEAKRNLALRSNPNSDSDFDRKFMASSNVVVSSGEMDAVHYSVPTVQALHGDSFGDGGRLVAGIPSDTFTAFTETVEALALQKSVIGNKNITPASPDEVARYIAATQARLQHSARLSQGHHDETHISLTSTDTSVLTHHEVPHHQASSHQDLSQTNLAFDRSTSTRSHDGLSSESGNYAETHPDGFGVHGANQESHPTHAIRTSSMSQDSVEKHHLSSSSSPIDKRVNDVQSKESLGDKQSLQGLGVTSVSVGDSPKPSKPEEVRSVDGKELIRVHPDGISRNSKKASSGWFWGKSSPEKPPADSAKSKMEKNDGKAGKTGAVEKNDGGKNDANKKSAASSNDESARKGKSASRKDRERNSTSDEASAQNGVEVSTSTFSSASASSSASAPFSAPAPSSADQVGNAGPVERKPATEDALPPGVSGVDVENVSRIHHSSTEHSVEAGWSRRQEGSHSIATTPDTVGSVNQVTTRAIVEMHPDLGKSPMELMTNNSNNSAKIVASTTQSGRTDAMMVALSKTVEAQTSTATTSTAVTSKQTMQTIDAQSTKRDSEMVSAATKATSQVSSTTSDIRSVQSTTIKVQRSVEEINRTFVSRELSSESVFSPGPGARGEGAGGEGGRPPIEQVLREKAKLEGEVEVLQGENREMLRQRAELLSRVATLTQELSSHKTSSRGLAGDRDALSADLETLRQNRARLEAVILDAHRLLEDKDEEMRTLGRDLDAARAVSDRYLEQISECRREVKSREATANDLKTKITELYVEFQTSNQSRILADNEVTSLQGEMKALAAAKDWYKAQLATFQREKVDLQAEVTRVKSEMIAQSTTIERLRADSSRTKRQLGDTEQRSLSEKQGLARHLETIEADMLEREAAFAQLQRERLAQAAAIAAPGTDQFDSSVLTEEVESARGEAARMSKRLAVLQTEHTEALKRIALTQESLAERDQALDELEKRCDEVTTRLSQSELALVGRDESIERLKHDRAALEVELAAAVEEKRVFDVSLRSLKEDMGVVETNFRSLKNELVAKQDEIVRLNDQLKSREGAGGKRPPRGTKDAEQFEEVANVHEFAPRHIIQALTRFQANETQTDAYALEGAALREETAQSAELRGRIAELENELTGARDALGGAERLRRQREEEKGGVERDLVLAKERLLDLELRFQSVSEERARFELELTERARTESERARAESERAREETERAKVEPERAIAVERVAALGTSSAASGAEREEERVLEEQKGTDKQTVEQLTRYEQQNKDLMSRLGDLQRESHMEIAKQKTKILKLNKQLEALLKEQKESSQSYELRLREVGDQLTTVQESRTRVEAELEAVRQRASLDIDAMTRQMQDDLQRANAEIESLHVSKRETETRLETSLSQSRLEVDEYIHRTTVLETELHVARTYIEEQRTVYVDTANLALELEREKGRLAGILHSHSTLKEHASSLEQSLASKESSVVELSSQVQQELEQKDRVLAELSEQVRLMEEALGKEQLGVKEARKLLLTEKGAHIKVKRELDQLNVDHKQLNAELDQLRKDITQGTADLETARQAELSLKVELERVGGELKVTTLDRDRLMREGIEMEAKEATMKEQIQSLEWRLSEKEAEVTAAAERAALIEERHQCETASLSRSIQSTTAEMITLRTEIASLKQDRAELRAQIVRLKDALRATIEQQTKMGAKSDDSIDYEELRRLLADAPAPAIESKPLSFLQATLTGLRGEISSLQLQVNEHTSVVQTSSQAWRELEAQVLDLRQVCQTSAADRAAAAQKLLDHPPPPSDLTALLQAATLSTTGVSAQEGKSFSDVSESSSSLATVQQSADGLTTLDTLSTSVNKTSTTRSVKSALKVTAQTSK